MSVCRHCAHDEASHTHHRPGTDCARCTCTQFGRSHRRAFLVDGRARRLLGVAAGTGETRPVIRPRRIA